MNLHKKDDDKNRNINQIAYKFKAANQRFLFQPHQSPMLQKKRDLHICRKLKYEKCGEKSILDEWHVMVLGFQSKARINRDEMYERWDCVRITSDGKFRASNNIARIIFPLTNGLSCERKTAPPPN